MNKILKLSLLGILSLSVMFGMGGVAQATVTLGAAAITGSGATTLSTSANGLTITGATASVWSTTAGDLTVQSAAGSLKLLGVESVADAIVIHASGTAGGIDIDSLTGGIDVDTTGEINLASSLAGDGAITIITSSSTGSIEITSTDTTADAIDINSSGGIDIDTGTEGAITITTTNDAVTIATGSAALVLTGSGSGVDALTLTQGDVTLTSGNMDVENNITCGDLVIDETAGVLSFTGATSATISTSTAGKNITLDSADAAAGTSQEYVNISGTTPAHAGGTPTDIFLDFDPTLGTNTAAADCHLIDMTFSSPAWGNAVASNLRGIYFAPSIGNATTGTNEVSMIEIANYTGDAQVNVTGIKIGTSDGLGTANAISIAASWDAGITTASPITLTSANGDLDAEDNITCGDLVIDETAGVINFSSGTTATISTTSREEIFFTTNSKAHKYAYIPLSKISATEVRVGGIGSGNLCVSLAGVDEIGTTEGYVNIDADTDFLRFTLPVPETFVDTDTQADLVLQLDIDEQAAEECNIDVRIFEYSATTPIFTGALAVANDQSRGWKDLTAVGFGNDADIDAEDVLLIEITATANADAFNIYGARLKYRVGIEVTQ